MSFTLYKLRSTVGTKTRQKPPYGKRLEERRTELHKSRQRIEDETRGTIYEMWLHRLEFGEKSPDTLTLTEIDKLARALEWTPHQLTEALEIELPEGLDTALTRQTVPPGHIETYPVYGSAAATFDADSDSEPEELVAINGEDRRRWGVRRKNVRAIRVNGDCLVSEGAQRGEFSINHGDTIFIDIDAPIQDGDLGVWWDHRTDTLIAKFAREESEGGKDAVVLYDARGRIQIREKDNPDLTPVGVVWARQELSSAVAKNGSSKRLIALSLFSGGGGFDLGFSAAGFRVACSSDIDPFSCKTLMINSGKKRFYRHAQSVPGDITKLSATELLRKAELKKEHVQIVLGGPPCQAFSVFGQRKGTEDPRGDLVWEYLRIIKEVQPEAFVFENVAGFRSIHDGTLYQDLLERLTLEGRYTVSAIITRWPISESRNSATGSFSLAAERGLQSL